MERTLPEWRDLLLKKLAVDTVAVAKQRRYYDGDQSLPTAPSTSSEKYRRLAKMAVTNLCGLIVDAPASKLTPQGVRLSDDADGDLALWREVWVKNKLNARCRIAFEESLKVGRSAMMVWPKTDDAGAVIGVSATVEDADQIVVAYAPGSLDERVAAMKLYTDDVQDFCTVWTPGEMWSWVRKARKDGTSTKGWLDDPDEDTRGENPLGAVPFVELLCKPNAKGVPAPELSQAVLHLQDRINKTMFDAVVAGEDGAFPQRVLIGIEIPHDDDGNPIEVKFGPNRVAAFDSVDPASNSGRIDQFQAWDNTSLIRLADTSIRQLGWISRTSSIFMLSGTSNVGADMIRALDDGFNAKVLAHEVVFGDALETMFGLALMALGRDVPDDIEIEWAPTQFRSPAEMADAAIKLRQAGYPFAAIAKHMGATPGEVKRLVIDREAELAEGTNADGTAATGGASRQLSQAELVQKVYLGVPSVLDENEARAIVGLPPRAATPAAPAA